MTGTVLCPSWLGFTSVLAAPNSFWAWPYATSIFAIHCARPRLQALLLPNWSRFIHRLHIPLRCVLISTHWTPRADRRVCNDQATLIYSMSPHIHIHPIVWVIAWTTPNACSCPRTALLIVVLWANPEGGGGLCAWSITFVFVFRSSFTDVPHLHKWTVLLSDKSNLRCKIQLHAPPPKYNKQIAFQDHAKEQ